MLLPPCHFDPKAALASRLEIAYGLEIGDAKALCITHFPLKYYEQSFKELSSKKLSLFFYTREEDGKRGEGGLSFKVKGGEVRGRVQQPQRTTKGLY